jgi:hypothetical protein
MAFFDEAGRVTDGASRWLGPVVALFVALGAVVGIYARFEAENAVQDERLHILEEHEGPSLADHDLLIRMDARLNRIEAALTRPEK